MVSQDTDTNMNKCLNCKHWKIEFEGDGYKTGTSFAAPESPIDEFQNIVEIDEQREYFGHATKFCHSPLLLFYERPQKGGATVADGSGYTGSLITSETFGCTNWQSAEN